VVGRCLSSERFKQQIEEALGRRARRGHSVSPYLLLLFTFTFTCTCGV
jgi:hypothetical protein